MQTNSNISIQQSVKDRFFIALSIPDDKLFLLLIIRAMTHTARKNADAILKKKNLEIVML